MGHTSEQISWQKSVPLDVHRTLKPQQNLDKHYTKSRQSAANIYKQNLNLVEELPRLVPLVDLK